MEKRSIAELISSLRINSLFLERTGQPYFGERFSERALEDRIEQEELLTQTLKSLNK